MANGIRTGDPRGFNNEHSSKFRDGSRVRQKAGGHIGRNVVEIIIKMKTIVQKPLMIKIMKLRLRNLDNKHMKKAGELIGWNVVEIAIKMKTIVRKPLMIKVIKLRLRNLDNSDNHLISFLFYFKTITINSLV